MGGPMAKKLLPWHCVDLLFSVSHISHHAIVASGTAPFITKVCVATKGRVGRYADYSLGSWRRLLRFSSLPASVSPLWRTFSSNKGSVMDPPNGNAPMGK